MLTDKEIKKHTGVIYCIQTPFSIKIGRTSNLEQRLQHHRMSYGLLRWYCSERYTNYKKIETKLHHYFKDNQLHGEHFDITLQQAKDAMDLICAEIGVFDMDQIKNKINLSKVDFVDLIKNISNKIEKEINMITVIEWCNIHKIKLFSFELFVEIEKYLQSIYEDLKEEVLYEGSVITYKYPQSLLDDNLPKILFGASLQRESNYE